ncbi:hypothetical protein GALMADRAFT_206135 [Galerina marginata CBS 339.88]|uniref:Uncharacterized protein n=1 Tax=Galerina marginata (strain CBS 339.88) TaxID=685588 RepID=A0A067TN40_GALM3|nr:hypothetical protein GALMADRAFT_206135 [Galerina marginata CBS 339.88]
MVKGGKAKVGPDGKTKHQRYLEKNREKIYAANALRKRETRRRSKEAAAVTLTTSDSTSNLTLSTSHNSSTDPSPAQQAIHNLLEDYTKFRDHVERWDMRCRDVINFVDKSSDFLVGWSFATPFPQTGALGKINKLSEEGFKLISRGRRLLAKLSSEISRYLESWEQVMNLVIQIAGSLEPRCLSTTLRKPQNGFIMSQPNEILVFAYVAGVKPGYLQLRGQLEGGILYPSRNFRLSLGLGIQLESDGCQSSNRYMVYRPFERPHWQIARLFTGEIVEPGMFLIYRPFGYLDEYCDGLPTLVRELYRSLSQASRSPIQPQIPPRYRENTPLPLPPKYPQDDKFEGDEEDYDTEDEYYAMLNPRSDDPEEEEQDEEDRRSELSGEESNDLDLW